MGKYLLKIAALLAALLLTLLACFAWVQSLPAQFGYSIMGTVRHKLELLQTTPGPRVILAGGSSSPYATNCEYIAGELGLPCINVGATGYLGLDFYLCLLEENTREGDVLVIAPEHIMLGGHSTSALTVWMAMENFPEVWAAAPKSYWPDLIRGYPEYAQNKISFAFDDIDQASIRYHPDFGPLGDVVAPRESLLEHGYIQADPVYLNAATLNPAVAGALNAFYETAAARGVRAFFAFAPVDALAIVTSAEEQAELDAAIHEQLLMPVLGHLDGTVMDGKYFYDSNNHLTSEGAALYSRQLAALLKEALAAG